MTLQEIIFDHPIAFYLIVLVPLFFWIYYRLDRFRKDALRKFGRSSVLKEVVRRRSPLVFWSKTVVVSLLWVLLVVAMAQPKGNGRYPEELALQKPSVYSPKGAGGVQKQLVQREAHEVIFLIDASVSMTVQDTPYGQSRLELAQEIADQIVSLLQGQTSSLFAFTSGATQLSPETNDYLFLRMMLNQVQINEGNRAGTDFYETLLDIRKKYLDKRTNKAKTLIVISDGGDTRLEELEGESFNQELQAVTALLGDATDNRMRVYTIGVGSKQGEQVPDVTYQGGTVVSRLDENVLRELARIGGGRYYNAIEMSPLVLANDLVESMEKGPTVEEEKEIRLRQKRTQDLGEEFLVYDFYFQYPLGIGIFLLAFLLLFPDSSERRLS